MFQNLKVLELASVLAGPSVGQFFAELGAEVIKVENPTTGGDVTRSWKSAAEYTDDRSAYFCSVNWGKKSLALDLTTSEAKKIIHRLAVKADIVIASYKPGDAQKLGVSYEQLTTGNKQLIYGMITGYGSDNDRVGYDAVIQAESGFMSLNGEKGGEPMKMPVALIDVLAGHQLKEGLLLALLKKEKTGMGGLVEVSLMQAAVASLVNQASNWLVGKNLPVRQGSLHPNIAPYGEVFLTKDGKRLLVAIGNDRQFIDLCEVLGISHQGLGNRFLTNQMRVDNRVHLQEILNAQIQERFSGELLQLIHEKRIPAGLVQNLKEVFEMEEAKGLIFQSAGLRGVRSFIVKDFGGWILDSGLLPPPHLGEHNEEICGK